MLPVGRGELLCRTRHQLLALGEGQELTRSACRSVQGTTWQLQCMREVPLQRHLRVQSDVRSVNEGGRRVLLRVDCSGERTAKTQGGRSAKEDQGTRGDRRAHGVQDTSALRLLPGHSRSCRPCASSRTATLRPEAFCAAATDPSHPVSTAVSALRHAAQPACAVASVVCASTRAAAYAPGPISVAHRVHNCVRRSGSSTPASGRAMQNWITQILGTAALHCGLAAGAQPGGQAWRAGRSLRGLPPCTTERARHRLRRAAQHGALSWTAPGCGGLRSLLRSCL